MEGAAEQKNLFSSKSVVALSIILFLLYAFNFYMISGITGKIAAAEQAKQPAMIEITKITKQCDGCYNVNAALDQIRNLNIKVVKEREVDSESQEGKELISKYSITKLPSAIITGEIDKDNVKSSWGQMGSKYGEIIKGAFVLNKQTPPFYSTERGAVVGGVKSIIIKDSGCPKCFDINSISLQLKNYGVKFSDEKILDYSSPEAKALVASLGITKIPAILISDEVTLYGNAVSFLNQLGATTRATWHIAQPVLPPYRDTGSGSISGLVTLVMLTDKSCTGCYDVNAHKSVLPNFFVVVGEEKTYDVSSNEGKGLVKKYGIEKVPTILISPNGKEYPHLVQVWPQVGTVEQDGWFVFRKVEEMKSTGAYMDLKAGKVVS
ncbi:MAG: hypothetical protein HZB68_01160 [Candidatus Aenigmarchaeota archaeon]|nr:hypothetical protein [Candidatus Aenigmarchaeota archaeon]